MKFKDANDKFEKISDIAKEIGSLSNLMVSCADKAGVAYECNSEKLTNDYLEDALSYLNRLKEVINKFKE